jgi:hypothetical protein
MGGEPATGTNKSHRDRQTDGHPIPSIEPADCAAEDTDGLH